MREELSREQEALIQGYLDDTLTEGDASRLREWLKKDERHLDELIRAADLHGVLVGLRSANAPENNGVAPLGPPIEAAPEIPVSPNPAFEKRPRATLRLGGVLSSLRSDWRRVKRIMKVAAGFAAAAGFVLLGQAFTQSPEAESEKIARLDKASGDSARDFFFRGWKGKDGSFDADPRGQSLMARLSDGDSVDRIERAGVGTAEKVTVERRGEFRKKADWGGRELPESLKEQKTSNLWKDQTGTAGQAGANAPQDAPKAGEEMPKQALPTESEALAGAKRAPPRIPSGEKILIATASAGDPVDEFESRPGQDNRKIVRNAEAAIEVDSYEAAYPKLLAMVALEKGYVSDGDIQKMPNGKIQANVTVRVPAPRFDALLGRLKELGTVKYQNIKSEDVTKEYFDHEARLKSKELLLERLKAVLKDAKGTAKELMEVEVQIGTTLEAIDKIKGELRYYDTVVSQSTLILGMVEKDLAQPFEYVQTLQSTLGIVARDPDAAYGRAQKEIENAGGQVVDSKMVRQSDTVATGTIRARVEAEKFPALRQALKGLGHVTDDTVNQQKTARGGSEGLPKADAPLKKELAVIDLTIMTPALAVTRHAALLVEIDPVPEAYPAARRKVEEAGGKVTSGSLSGHGANTSATLTADIDVDKFASLLEALKASGTLKDSRVRLDLPAQAPGAAADLVRERGEIELSLVSPPRLIDDEHGIARTVRDTFAGSWKGILWSVEKLFVGLSLAGPWIGLLVLGWLGWRLIRRKKPVSS